MAIAGTSAGPGRRRALAVAIVSGLALLIVFTVFVLQLAENAVRREAEGRVRTTAELSARLVGEQSLRFYEVVSAYATRLADLPTPVRARLPAVDHAALLATLQDMQQEVVGISSVAFSDRLGRLVAAVPASSLPPGTDLSGRDWYRGIQKVSPYLSRAYIAAGAQPRKVTVEAVKAFDRRGRLLGILTATETQRTQTFTDTYGSEVGATVTVTDQAGVVVGSTGDTSERLVSRARDPLVAQALRGRSGVRLGNVDGRRTVSGYAPVRGTGWTVLAEVPASQAFADVPRLRVTLLLGAGVVAFLLFWMVPLLAGRLSRARDALGVSEAFQRDLLPQQMPPGVHSLYRASERRMLLGGDFIDAVRTPDGGLAILVGDVCGHGPRAAALGASLRAGWRTLASAGVGIDRLDLLDLLVEGERRDEDVFATVVCAWISEDGRTLRYAIAGHPPPLLLLPSGTVRLEGPRGAALGLGATGQRPTGERELPPGWALVLYTDGLIEARPDGGRERLGVDGLVAWATDPDGRADAERLMQAVARLADETPGGLDDDLALVVVDTSSISPGVRTTATTRSIEHA
ncbi:MAG: magnesium or manganese-dependent protein phosphatase [Solirubrobacterales bacterium]|nr:magnesium or manganese-dependent protein phosphatase [Solirubrobacterales bacterium]